MGSQEVYVHDFFQRLRENRYAANNRAQRGTTHNKFVYYFSILFREMGQVPRRNMNTWLNAIANNFTFNTNFVKPFMMQEAHRLFQELQLDPNDEQNMSVFEFWICFNKIYLSLYHQNYFGGDNILGFMTGFPIHETRVVIIGQDPTRSYSSSGFAFHQSPCVSTRNLVKFLEDEASLISRLSGNSVPQMYSNQLERARNSGDLRGWINQGVLLINSMLTREKANWAAVVNFFIEYLSDEMDDLVFILAGRMAIDKARLIDQNKHLVMRVYHPASYSYQKRE